jgi:hypothetical protein
MNWSHTHAEVAGTRIIRGVYVMILMDSLASVIVHITSNIVVTAFDTDFAST